MGHSLTLLLALLLAAGLAAGWLAARLRLPRVTGYIGAGVLLGPAGLGMVPGGVVAAQLDHFSQLALMLVAFGIGEHLEFSRLRRLCRPLAAVATGETLACLLLVGGGFFLFFLWRPVSGSTPGPFLFALLLAAVSLATAPASTLHVVRETAAAGPLTRLLLAEVAVNNGLAIVVFGFVLALAASGGAAGLAHGAGIVFFSLALGLVTGLLIEALVHRLADRGEMLTCGLALLLLCGEAARFFGWSPLLAGMAAGGAMVNRDRRDVRLFRVINAFEPPIYVLFFLLAGVHLERQALVQASWLGVFYFLLRGVGKVTGAGLGAHLAGVEPVVARHLGWTLLPQAGVAIGLVVLLETTPGMEGAANFFTPVVLAGVVLAELTGPVAARQALVRAGETAAALAPAADAPAAGDTVIVPWRWQRLQPPDHPQGTVVFGASLSRTVTGLARVATLLAHRYRARPLAVRVVPLACEGEACTTGHELFRLEEEEVRVLGYDLAEAVIHSDDVAEAILETARQAEARAVVLGYTGGSVQDFNRVIGNVVRRAPCPVVVVHFCAVMHTERILVPVVRTSDCNVVAPVLEAVAAVGRHRITLVRLLPSDVDDDALEEARLRLEDWAFRHHLGPFVHCRAVATDARVATVTAEAAEHDCLVMAAGRGQGMTRFFVGSLALDVVAQCPRTALVVYPPAE